MKKDEKIEMSKEDIEELADIINNLKCPNDLQCLQTGFEKVCRARPVGDQGDLECLSEAPSDCKFAVLCHNQFFMCQCPLRKYIATKFKKK